MEPLLCFPNPPSPELAKALEAAGYTFTAVADADGIGALEPTVGWSGAVVSAVDVARGGPRAMPGAAPARRTGRARSSSS